VLPFVYCSYRSLSWWDDWCHHYQSCLYILGTRASFSNLPDSYYAVPRSKYFKICYVTRARTVILKGERYDRPTCLPVALFLSYLPISVARIQAATKVVIWKVTPQIYQLHSEDNSSF
jgi:hypothetical protein